PSPARLTMLLRNSRRGNRASPLVGSSRTSTCGSPARGRARPTRAGPPLAGDDSLAGGVTRTRAAGDRWRALNARGGEGGREPADVGGGHPVVEARLLGAVADARAEVEGVVPAVVAEDGGPPAVGLDLAGEQAEGGGFAGPVVAEQGEDRPGGDLE